MDTSLIFIISIISLVWLLILSIVVFRMVSHYNRLTLGVTTYTLKEVLDNLMEAKGKHEKYFQKVEQELLRLASDGRYHFQRLGVVRFNPFSDTGGSQSFTLALLDGHDNGFIMTSLYARTGNRWYIKHITAGRCPDVELSKEEQTAIKNAKPIASGRQ